MASYEQSGYIVLNCINSNSNFIIWLKRDIYSHRTVCLFTRTCMPFQCLQINFSEQYLAFDVIYMMDYLSRTCLGFLIFIEIIKALKHLTFNYYVYMMRMTLSLAGHEMISCTFVISIFIMAFASFQYLTLGPYLHLFKDMTSSIVTSIRIATAFVKMKIYVQADFDDTVLNKAMFISFFVIVTLTLMDVFISIINNAIECIKANKVSKSTKRRMYDSQLNEYFWRKVNEILPFVNISNFSEDAENSKTAKRKYQN